MNEIFMFPGYVACPFFFCLFVSWRDEEGEVLVLAVFDPLLILFSGDLFVTESAHK